jgi:hypothetical protein
MTKRKLSTRELAMIAIILDEEEREHNKNPQSRRYWVHDALKKRKIEGEYWTLFKHLIDDEEKFFMYFRMTSFQFNELLIKVENVITRKNTTFRDSLTPREKLAVCLR